MVPLACYVAVVLIKASTIAAVALVVGSSVVLGQRNTRITLTRVSTSWGLTQERDNVRTNIVLALEERSR